MKAEPTKDEDTAIAEFFKEVKREHREHHYDIDSCSFLEQAARNLITRTEQKTASAIYDFIYFNGVICGMSLQQMMSAFKTKFNIKKSHDFSREPTAEERELAIKHLSEASK